MSKGKTPLRMRMKVPKGLQDAKGALNAGTGEVGSLENAGREETTSKAFPRPLNAISALRQPGYGTWRGCVANKPVSLKPTHCRQSVNFVREVKGAEAIQFLPDLEMHNRLLSLLSRAPQPPT
ncbi:hypothetical protein E2C01_088165 [Portunus trituberculatus]|uniref:Uncharacterized protein n=1 Tax=Portunus trituberculatus TaxID=210409 RepID=A0A5B7JDR5_PORTR|nr:hypothetical protein [Portunus trituberculatus]